MSRRTDFSELYRRVSTEIKNFLFSKENREFLVFLFFFVLAAFCWLMQTLGNEYETDFTIPVKLAGVPQNVIITTDPVSEVHVRIHDKGTTLMRYKISGKFRPAVIEFKDVGKRSKQHIQLLSEDLRESILSQFSATAKLISITPDTIEYYYTRGKSRKLPVRFAGRIQTQRQYYFTDTIFSPDSVEVYATSAVFDTLRVAPIRYLTMEDVGDTINQQVNLAKLKGVKFEPSKVRLTMPTDIYTEKTVEVPVGSINFPEGKVLRAFPSKVQVTFQVGLSRFRDISPEDFLIVVNYDDLVKRTDGKFPISLKQTPKGILGVRFNPEQIDFLIEQNH